MTVYEDDNSRAEAWASDEQAGVLDTNRGGNKGPVSWQALLRDLGLTDAPEDLQIAAAEEWLKHNKPTPMMRLSLDRLGVKY